MKKYLLFSLLVVISLTTISQESSVFPGAGEKSPSRAEYFSWINNTNEGATESQTLINLAFFEWLRKEYGMQLDIYAFDAGAIDGKRFYGSICSERFKSQFPRGFDPVYNKATELGIRLGVWGGPDGFGESPEDARERIDQMVKLCRDYRFELFKFDAVCGPLRPEKEDYFIEMMQKAREYSPDLILLNHRLGLDRGKPYATTFLWGGAETYIDVFMNNRVTAPHHRAEALSRGVVPGLMRLTEDHGVCISSCIDYWDDDLILQAFNRNLILSPQIYGNPWLMRDDEFPALAFIFNLHRRYRDILVEGMLLPETYGPFAVSRGNDITRVITLRNLSWNDTTYFITPGDEIGLSGAYQYYVKQYHPVVKVMGSYPAGEKIGINVPAFRSALVIVSSEKFNDTGIIGSEYHVIKSVDGEPEEIELIGLPGTVSYAQLENSDLYSEAFLDDKHSAGLINGRVVKLEFPGRPLEEKFHRMIADFKQVEIPDDAMALYEATVFAADNNALEVRSLQRSGATSIKEVREARDAFFNQETFVKRGIWDRNLFDGDPATGFWPSRKYNADQRIEGGCFRLDLGAVINVDKIVLKTPDEYSLQPLLKDEANYVEVSSDLVTWEQLSYLAGEEMIINVGRPARYFRFREYADRLNEIELFSNGQKVNPGLFRASNLFAHPSRKKAVKAWKAEFTPGELAPNSYISVAINGEHGVEGAYAAIKVDGKYIGAPDRARSYPSNTWEYINARGDSNYTYYFPVDKSLIGKTIEIYVLAFNKDKTDLEPEAWISANPAPYQKISLKLIRKEPLSSE